MGQEHSKYSDLIRQIESGSLPLSFSKIREFSTSPRSFIRYCLREKSSTKAARFGSMWHCLVLEPMAFEKNYAIAPDCALNTNAGKEKYFEFLTETLEAQGVKSLGDMGILPGDYNKYGIVQSVIESNGIEIVRRGDYDRSLAMSEAVRSDSRAKEILDSAFYMEKDFENMPLMGYLWRGKIDVVCDNNDTVDFKTVTNANPRKMKWTIREENYDMQQLIYGAFVPNGNRYIIAVDGDLEVSVNALSRETMAHAEQELERILAAFEYCKLLNKWNESYGFWSDNGEFSV